MIGRDGGRAVATRRRPYLSPPGLEIHQLQTRERVCRAIRLRQRDRVEVSGRSGARVGGGLGGEGGGLALGLLSLGRGVFGGLDDGLVEVPAGTAVAEAGRAIVPRDRLRLPGGGCRVLARELKGPVSVARGNGRRRRGRRRNLR